jgi:hypothetical protein
MGVNINWSYYIRNNHRTHEEMTEQGKHELKAQFVELSARGLSYAKKAKMLKLADGN